jgi:hypothetical protein
VAVGLCLLSLFGGGRVHAEDDPVLTIEAAKTRKITKSELLKSVTPNQVTLYSPVYQHSMTYEGFWLDEVLTALHVHLTNEDDVVFQCEDGYGTSMPVTDIGKQKWLVAYGEPGGWTALPERKKPTLPGPWYVVGRDPGSYQEFPWPYQVIGIKIRGDW